MEIIDCLNNQFMLYDFLSPDLVSYINYYNLSINYYCIFQTVIDNATYIITSSTTKKVNNGHRLIIIDNIEKGANSITCTDVGYIIQFGNKFVNISNCLDNINDYIDIYDIKIIEPKVVSQVFNNTISASNLNNYNKNILEQSINTITNLIDFKVLKLFKNVRTIAFGSDFNKAIDKNLLPIQLQTLIFNGKSPIITKELLPNNLQAISFTLGYEHPIYANTFPDCLSNLDLGEWSSCEIMPNILPRNLKLLKLSDDYNYKLAPDVLPYGLRALVFGAEYNQPIELNVLPPYLEIIQLGLEFKQPIEKGVLPEKLKYLAFYTSYNIDLKALVLPRSLKKIYLWYTTDVGMEHDKNFVERYGKLVEHLDCFELENLINQVAEEVD
jgi:hypothetical protein